MEDNYFSFVPDFLEAETTYTVKVKAVIQNKEVSEVKKLSSHHQSSQSAALRKSVLIMLM